MTIPVDLRLRLCLAFVLPALLTAVNGFAPACAAMVAALLLHTGSRQSFPWRRLLHLEGFLILLFVTLPFTMPGTPLLTLGPLTASIEGASRAATLAAKVTASVLLLAFLFAATDPLHLGNALRALRTPEPLVRLFVAVTRQFGVIRAEFSRLQDAMRARAFHPRSDRHTWRSYGNLMGMLIVRALERADRVEEAMRLRGYTGRFPRTALAGPSVADWAITAALIGATALLLLWDKA